MLSRLDADSVVTALITAAVSFFFWRIIYDAVKEYFSSRRGPMTGRWIQKIPEQNNRPYREDEVNCRQVGSSIRGSIVRRIPVAEKGARWEFHGRVTAKDVYMIFWRVKAPAESYGTIQLYAERPSVLSGFYIKQEARYSGSEYSSRPIETKLAWGRPGVDCVLPTAATPLQGTSAPGEALNALPDGAAGQGAAN